MSAGTMSKGAKRIDDSDKVAKALLPVYINFHESGQLFSKNHKKKKMKENFSKVSNQLSGIINLVQSKSL